MTSIFIADTEQLIFSMEYLLFNLEYDILSLQKMWLYAMYTL